MSKLNEKAMLVHLTVHQWMGRVKDVGASEELAIQKNASSEAGTSVLISLAPKRLVNPIDNAGWAARLEHQRLTLPWMDKGHRILPANMFMKYTECIRAKVTVFQERVNDFLEEYPKLMEDAERKQRLGELGKGVVFPSVDELRARFSIHTDVLPMPDAADFRISIGEDEAAQIKADIEKNIGDKMKQAQNDLWARLGDLVGKVHERLSDSDKKFRDSLMENLKDFCKLIPDLNIVDDPNLETMRVEVMEKLSKEWKPDDMRNNTAARQKAAKDAKEMLDKMNAFFVV
jgi:hypothetical protein